MNSCEWHYVLRVLNFCSKLKEPNRSIDGWIKFFKGSSHKLLKPHPFIVPSLALFDITTFSPRTFPALFTSFAHARHSIFVVPPLIVDLPRVLSVSPPPSLYLCTYLLSD